MVKEFTRAQLGIDGNCAFALLGDNLQEGESEFVEIEYRYGDVPMSRDQVAAAKMAFDKLKARLGDKLDSFYFGPSHPYGD